MKLTLAIFDPFRKKRLNAKPQAFKDRAGVFLISRHLRD
jgi:hypothetical protein